MRSILKQKAARTIMAIGLAIVAGILIGRTWLETEYPYYVGPILSIDEQYIEIRIMIDNGEIQNFHEARYDSLRIDDYMVKYDHGIAGERPEVGKAYIFFYRKVEGSEEYALSYLIPFRDPPIEARIVRLR